MAHEKSLPHMHECQEKSLILDGNRTAVEQRCRITPSSSNVPVSSKILVGETPGAVRHGYLDSRLRPALYRGLEFFTADTDAQTISVC